MADTEEETVGKLDGEPAVERVILQSEVKLYRAKAVLAYLDGPVYDFAPARIEIFPPIAVFDDGMKKIGHASVTLEKTPVPRLLAEIAIDYASEARLLIETKQLKLYPRIWGSLAAARIPIFDFSAPIVTTRLTIEGIQLLPLPTNDTRLVPLGEPVL